MANKVGEMTWHVQCAGKGKNVGSVQERDRDEDRRGELTITRLHILLSGRDYNGDPKQCFRIQMDLKRDQEFLKKVKQNVKRVQREKEKGGQVPGSCFSCNWEIRDPGEGERQIFCSKGKGQGLPICLSS